MNDGWAAVRARPVCWSAADISTWWPLRIASPGADLNYYGGQALPLNRSYPAIRSPVTGIVTRAGEGDYGTIAIQDENGLSHQILHTQSRHVAVGDPVVAGQLIGTMGNTGVDHRGLEGGDFHVHYQIKDRGGSIINPIEFWNQQGPIDPNLRRRRISRTICNISAAWDRPSTMPSATRRMPDHAMVRNRSV